MNQPVPLKPVHWIASSRRDLLKFPKVIQDDFGHALFQAQRGEKHDDARPLKGFGDASVLEVAGQYRGESYRAVYTVRFADAVYVLHVFHKKSRHGISTPREAMALIQTRLQQVFSVHSRRRPAP